MSKFLKAKNIKRIFETAGDLRQQVAISTIYHATVHGNVAMFDGVCRAKVHNIIDTEYRPLIAVAWDKTENKYKYDRAKSTKILAKLGVDFGEELSYEDFITAVSLHLNPEKSEDEIRAEEKAKAAKSAKAKTTRNNKVVNEIFGKLPREEWEAKIIEMIAAAQA